MISTYDQREILDLLPHRSPLLLAEHLEISQVNQSGIGWMRLPSEPLWNDENDSNFYPEMLLEGSAQLGGLLAHALTIEMDNSEPKHFLVGFPEYHFENLASLKSDNPVEVHLRLKARIGGMSRFIFSCNQDSTRLGSGEVTLV